MPMRLGQKMDLAKWEARILNKLERRGACLIWTGGKDGGGYGYVRRGGRCFQVHRVVFEKKVKKIPRGKILDHLCRRRACANWKHLEIVTHRVNILRGNGACAKHARKVKCKYGHYLSGRNLWVGKSGARKGFRHCRKCLTRRQKKWATKAKHI